MDHVSAWRKTGTIFASLTKSIGFVTLYLVNISYLCTVDPMGAKRSKQQQGHRERHI